MNARVTLAQLASGEKLPKYRAQPTVVDGIRFDSRAEARRYGQLKLLQDVREISALTLQPSFDCVVNGQKICTYRADFEYREKDGSITTEDVKGMRTPVYKLKKKLVEALYDVTIREVRA